MATLMGITLTLTPPLAILGIVAGLGLVLLLWWSAFRSSWGLFACFTVMLGLSLYYQIDRELVLGLAALASLVILRSVVTRRLRARTPGSGTCVGPGIRLGVRVGAGGAGEFLVARRIIP